MLRPNPFLHVSADRIYNPLTDRALTPGDAAFAQLRGVLDGRGDGAALLADGWVLRDGEDLSRRYLLKIVSLETLTTCNQKCYFCPVSIAPRQDEEMPVPHTGPPPEVPAAPPAAPRKGPVAVSAARTLRSTSSNHRRARKITVRK